MERDPVERLLQAADTPREPRPQFADALLRTLLAQIDGDQSEREGEKTTMNTAVVTPPVAGSASPVSGWWWPRPAGNQKRSRVLSYLASAALLLLTLVGGLYAMGSPRDYLGLLPQSSPDVENELIASAAVETMPDVLPGAFTYTGMSRFTLEPGESMEFGPDREYGDGVSLFEVEAGALSLESTGPTELMTGGSDQGTPLPDGANATLQAGDRGVLWPGTAATWRNDGQEPTVVLYAGAGELTNPVNYTVDEITLVKSMTIGWPDPPATFTFRRLTFEPGASLPAAEAPGLMLLAVASGEIDVSLDNGDRTFGPVDGTKFVAENRHLAPDGDLRNSGSEPAVVYVLLGESTEPAATPDA
jgi:hypothetical protein